MAERYRIDYQISSIDEEDCATEIAFGGTSTWGTVKEAAHDIESQIVNEEWTPSAFGRDRGEGDRG